MSSEVGQSWSKSAPYHELDMKESHQHSSQDGTQKTITLQAFDDRSATVQVNSSVRRIPLGHFARTTEAQPPGDVVNVVEIEEVKIGVDVTRAFMTGSKYSLSLINLNKDVRLYVGEAGEPISPPGVHIFPVANYQWNFADNWLNKVPYGWHLGIDCNADRGQPLVAVTNGEIIAIRHYQPEPYEPEDYWGTIWGYWAKTVSSIVICTGIALQVA